MQGTLSPILEDGGNLAEDVITEPPNHAGITPTQVPQGSSSKNGESSSVVTTLLIKSPKLHSEPPLWSMCLNQKTLP
eukprot:15361021-Ditylum_brightwellii.AAC.1